MKRELVETLGRLAIVLRDANCSPGEKLAIVGALQAIVAHTLHVPTDLLIEIVLDATRQAPQLVTLINAAAMESAS